MFERAVIVTKPTALEELLRRHSRSSLQFMLERQGVSIAEYEQADEVYKASLHSVQASIPDGLARAIVPRDLVPSFLFRETDLVLVLGPDGLCANVMKYLDGQAILGVNPDPERIDGVLVRFAPNEVKGLCRKLLKGDFRTDPVTLAKATTNDGQTMYAVNDFLIGRRDHVSPRYTISFNGETERQSSSGILVSTGVGSSGWLRSMFAGAAALFGQGTTTSYQFDGEEIPFDWSDERLFFAVREPFASKYTKTTILADWIETDDELVITSEMPEVGAIFSDGVIEDALEFNSGTVVTISVADKTGQLIAK